MSDCLASPSEILLAQIADGDQQALEKLLTQHRNYVRRVVEARLEPRLRSRVDPSDIVQESLTIASRRIDDYLTRRPTSFRIWLRRKVLEQLIDTRRRHYAQKRDVRRELSIGSASSMSIAGVFLGDRASEIAKQREFLIKVESIINELPENDREILLMRHSEGLTNEETAEVLQIERKTASKRYGRAVHRLATELKRQGF